MANKAVDYKKLSAELDAIVESMQSSDLDVDEALKKYERGVSIAKKLETYLKNAENKVKKIRTELSGE